MGQAYKCDICGRFFEAEPQSGGHTMLSDGIQGHRPLDICEEHTVELLNFIQSRIDCIRQSERPESVGPDIFEHPDEPHDSCDTLPETEEE